MRNQRVVTHKKKLDALFDYIKELRGLNNLQIESQWAIYLCIRVSGFLEVSIRSIYVNYCQDKSHPNITRYIGDSFQGRRSQNMKPKNILDIAGSFNPEWENELSNYISNCGRKEAIESVINIRNSASHGGDQGVTYTNAKDYYEKIWDVIKFIEAQCQK